MLRCFHHTQPSLTNFHLENCAYLAGGGALPKLYLLLPNQIDFSCRSCIQHEFYEATFDEENNRRELQMELNHLTNKHQNGIHDDKPVPNGNSHQNGEKEVEIMCTNL